MSFKLRRKHTSIQDYFTAFSCGCQCQQNPLNTGFSYTALFGIQLKIGRHASRQKTLCSTGGSNMPRRGENIYKHKDGRYEGR